MSSLKIPRVYRRFDEWEEVPHNMWGEVEDHDKALAQAIDFTGDHQLYGSYMKRVVSEWPASCENALTDHNINRKAWLGHAAVALALNIPEDITRKAWGMLNGEQQLLANRQAERYIKQWEIGYRESEGLHRNVAQKVLFR